MNAFERRNRRYIGLLGRAKALKAASSRWIAESSRLEYSYHFTWLGLPIIQFPADIVALQEVVWRSRPDLIIETGIARGGSVIFYASLMELIGSAGLVVGVDNRIRASNRRAIEAHPLAKRVRLVEGSSVDEETVRKVFGLARRRKRILVVLDSNHTHAHVARELELYSPLVGKGGYIVVLDTVIERMPRGYFRDRPWDRGNNPMTAVREFLRRNRRFVVDKEMDKLLIGAAPGGYLRATRGVPARRPTSIR
jgi:cephalosporin hydroxylase